jgi:hypothetical protein
MDYFAEKNSKALPSSVFLIRNRMKDVLGFTTRYDQIYDKKVYEITTTVYLDFFNESKRTMFILKYSELLTDDY